MNDQFMKEIKGLFNEKFQIRKPLLPQTLLLLLLLLSLLPLSAFSQVILQGYVYESGNRGYLEGAAITIIENESKVLKGNAATDINGKFEIALAEGKEYLIRINKKPFEPIEKVISATAKSDGDKIFEKFEMERLPGYVFEVTLASVRSDEDVVVDAITGAWIEVYNNTMDKEILNLKDHPSHTFSCRFEQGSHYTILLRKDGFFNKRLEAYVNVKGCILCFDGVGEVKPGVSDVLTEGFEMGTLLANVELQPISMNSEIEINNIYYDNSSARLKTKAKEELDELVIVLNDNKTLLVEIGSHTDSRGDTKFNHNLSLKRAESVVEYLIDSGIVKQRMVARGYGESKLRNSCANGVKCSEIRHQKNRRTELKVIGYVHDQLVDSHSLAEQKEIERMEELLSGLANSEIKIAEGETMPEDLKKQLKKQEEANMADSKSKDVKPAIKKEKALMGKREKAAKKRRDEAVETVLLETIDGQTIKMKVIEKDGVPAKRDQQLAIRENVQKPEINNNPTMETVPVIEEVIAEEMPVLEDSSVDELFDTGSEIVAEENIGMVPEREIKTNNFIRAPKKLNKDFTGFKVQVVISTYKLPLSHEILSRHVNIMLEETNKGTYAYLLGKFNNKNDAADFMNRVLSEQYANARVVEYVGGRRLVR
jgi:outer membrane protein OmpA-like peptidoglycan-associated protein